jgi:Transcriptional activator of glycolytic enzymes
MPLLHGRLDPDTAAPHGDGAGGVGDCPGNAQASPPPPPPAPAPAPAPVPRVPPEFTTLPLSTVDEVWREWKEGIGDNPPVERLEAEWGARWRPDARMRKWFSRRKVIWDRLKELIVAGQTAGDAVGQLERLRNGRSLSQLVKLLQSQKAKAQAQAQAQAQRR